MQWVRARRRAGVAHGGVRAQPGQGESGVSHAPRREVRPAPRPCKPAGSDGGDVCPRWPANASWWWAAPCGHIGEALCADQPSAAGHTRALPRLSCVYLCVRAHTRLSCVCARCNFGRRPDAMRRLRSWQRRGWPAHAVFLWRRGMHVHRPAARVWCVRTPRAEHVRPGPRRATMWLLSAARASVSHARAGHQCGNHCARGVERCAAHDGV